MGKKSDGAMLADDELRELVSLARRAFWAGRETHRHLQDAGVQIVPCNFYSNIPSVRDVESSFEYRPNELDAGGPYVAGGLFDSDRIDAFTRSLLQFAQEFDPPMDGDPENPVGFYWRNPAFSFSDAMAYYCILRLLRPKRVVEIGSGFSTLVADQALQANGEGEIIIVEPYPKPFLKRLGTVSRLIESPVQDIPERELVELIDGCQVWFIDSTHTVKTGSDCLYIYLKIMPQVTSKVLCHSHDVYLPYAMPSQFTMDRHIYWTEQYLLQAYLLDNPKARVMYGSAYLHRVMPELCKTLMLGRHGGGGASLWYELDGRKTR